MPGALQATPLLFPYFHDADASHARPGKHSTLCVTTPLRFTHIPCNTKRTMNLRDFLTTVGDEKAAKLFRTKIRTVASWRRGERLPRFNLAKRIVSKSPVTYEGIYGKAA